MSPRDFPETAALAEADPCTGLGPDAPEALLRAAWARFDARLGRRTAGVTGAAIFARRGQIQPLTVLRAASVDALTPDAI